MNHINKEWLHQKYWGEGLSTVQIADLCSCTSTTIQKTMVRLGIQRRTIRESLSEWYKTHKRPMAGKQPSEKTKGRISISLKNYYETHDNPMNGRHHTKQTKHKIRLSRWKRNKEHPVSMETKRKTSVSVTGKSPDENGWSRNHYKRIAYKVFEEYWHEEPPKGYYVHHVDRDFTNNHIVNLALVTPGNHSRIHNPRGKKNTNRRNANGKCTHV